MTKQIHIGDVKIPVTQYASQGNAVLGIRDSGKTYSATYLAEQLYAAKIPFVAFDPSGVWKFLRVPGHGDGLPVVVAGGKSPDLPLTPHSAPEIVRAAMRANVSLVLDFYDIHLSKGDWGRIVEQCIRVLLYENGEHGLRHIFIEEAAEFAPQQVTNDKAKVYAEVEKLARIGGNALLGYTLINQRAEQVNKAVLELCDCLFLHRQKGKNSLKSLAKWLDYSQGGGSKEIVQGLPTLPTGECWIWPAGAESATHVKMPTKRTFHPDRRALIANPAAASVQRVDATEFVSELKQSLDKFVEEAEANDPKKLKARIAELEAMLRKTATNEAPKTNTADVEALRRTIAILQTDKALLERDNRDLEEHRDRVLEALGHAQDQVDEIRAACTPRILAPAFKPSAPAPTAYPSPVRLPIRTSKPTVSVPRPPKTNGSGDHSLPRPQFQVLRAMYWLRNEERSVSKVAFYSDYSPTSSSYEKALGALRSAGLVSGWAITDAGERLIAHHAGEKPEGSTLVEWLRAKLDGPQLKVFDALVAAGGRRMANTVLAPASDYSVTSSSFEKALGKLRAIGAADGYEKDGGARAAEVFFG